MSPLRKIIMSSPPLQSMAKAPTKLLHSTIIFFNVMILVTLAQTQRQQFIYNGFHGAKLHLDKQPVIHSNGLLQLTNGSPQEKGHAFHPTPVNLTNSLAFSTTFAFAMYPQYPNLSAEGIAFLISPSMDFSRALAGEYFGIFNSSSDGLSTNHIFAVELDTLQIPAFQDINDNHVGIDVNSVRSIAAAPVAYYNDKDGKEEELRLLSGKSMQIWIDYDERDMLVSVTIAPLRQPKPKRLLLSKHVNLSAILLDSAYVGFSSSTGATSSQLFIQGWSFSQYGQAQGLDYSKLPSLPPLRKAKKKIATASIILLGIVITLLIIILGAIYSKRRKKYAEVLEDWEKEYIVQRFPYKDLYKATKGFQDKELLGCGGFGKVYKGTLPHTKVEVAVKRVSHDSKQGMKEFVTEIASMRKLRHRNLVQLLGYCRRNGELLLVYDYMSNGSLDKFLFSKENTNLSWKQRFRIIRGVASALLYLHEECEQIVLHRDVKASNVLLDADMNARLGDFGLARLYDHGTNSQTTHLVGTVGYLAPELLTTGKATTSSDVFSFGVFMLEVASGKRPISPQDFPEQIILVDWISDFWKKGVILEARDLSLDGYYSTQEMELVLKLGLLCSHSRPEARPTMRQVMQFLDGDAILPEIPPDSSGFDFFSSSVTTSASFPSSSGIASISSFNNNNTTDSILQCGR